MTPFKSTVGRTGPLSGWFYIRDLASGLYFTKAGGPSAPRRLADPFRSWEKEGVALTWYGSATLLSTKVQFEQPTFDELMRATGRWAGASKSDRKRYAAQINGRAKKRSQT